MIKVITVNDYEELSAKAFEVMKGVLDEKPNAVLGLATGSSPIGLYKQMIRDHEENGTSYQNVITFNLDEYVGLPKEHPESYYSFMHRNLFDHIDVKEKNIHIPSSQGDDLQKNCDDYNRALSEHQIDIQLLGIGSDGHIGFNEPGTPFDSVTHIAELKESTIRDNARFFDGDINQVPTKAITMGIANCMAAKKILLVANGKNKAQAIYDTVLGKVTEKCPASVLQRHPDVVIIVDKEAASLLEKKKGANMEIVNAERFNEIVSTEEIVLADFFADWCGPCKMLSPILTKLSEKYAGKVAFVKVNVDQEMDLAVKYGVSSIPNLFLFKNGKVVNQVLGFQSEPALVQFIESAF